MIFVLDNYDSFTYNLVQYLGELGATLLVRRNDQITLDEIAGLAPSHIVISPGPGRPEDAGVTPSMIERFGPSVPILGVCLGHQAIGLVCGGRVVRAPVPMHGKTSVIEHDGRGVSTGLASPIEASRYHSLIVEEQGLPAAGRSVPSRIRRDHGRAPHAAHLPGRQVTENAVLTDLLLELTRHEDL